jgi:hypothetical protein
MRRTKSNREQQTPPYNPSTVHSRERSKDITAAMQAKNSRDSPWHPKCRIWGFPQTGITGNEKTLSDGDHNGSIQVYHIANNVEISGGSQSFSTFGQALQRVDKT